MVELSSARAILPLGVKTLEKKSGLGAAALDALLLLGDDMEFSPMLLLMLWPLMRAERESCDARVRLRASMDRFKSSTAAVDAEEE